MVIARFRAALPLPGPTIPSPTSPSPNRRQPAARRLPCAVQRVLTGHGCASLDLCSACASSSLSSAKPYCRLDRRGPSSRALDRDGNTNSRLRRRSRLTKPTCARQDDFRARVTRETRAKWWLARQMELRPHQDQAHSLQHRSASPRFRGDLSTGLAPDLRAGLGTRRGLGSA